MGYHLCDNDFGFFPTQKIYMDIGKRIKYTCRVCLQKEAIYQCPKCLTRSCSIQCAQQHRVRGSCSGRGPSINDKPVKEMTLPDLERDVKFLESVGDLVERHARQESIISAERFGVVLPHSLSPKAKISRNLMGVKMLKERAEKVHVYLKICPPSLTRRKINSTCLSNSKAQKVLRWRLEWFIHPGNHENSVLTVADRAVSQETRMEWLIARFFDKSKAFSGNATFTHLNDLDEYIVLMRDESLPADERGYLQLDHTRKLKEVLAGSVIVEFPSFYIVSKGDIKALDEKSKMLDCVVASISTDSESDHSVSDSETSSTLSSSSEAITDSSHSSDIQIFEVANLNNKSAPQKTLYVPEPPKAHTLSQSNKSEDSDPETAVPGIFDGFKERDAMLQKARGTLLGFWQNRP